jgi:hypothetical protein
MRKAFSITFCLFILLSLLSTSVATAQTDTVLIAAVEDESVYIARIEDRGTQARTVFTGGQNIGNIAWDPQLLWFIFTYTDADGAVILAVSDNMGSPAYPLAEDIAPIPPSFNAVGDQIIYAVDAGEGLIDVYSLQVRSFQGFGETAKIASIPYALDCDRSELIAPQAALMKEIGGVPELGLNRQILFLSRDGLIHNEGCAATKTLLTDLDTRETVEIAHDLQWAVPSRDGTLVAGLSDGELVIATTDAAYYEPQPTSAPPSYPIAWGDQDHPNSLFYTSRVQNGRRALDPADEQTVLDFAGEGALGFWNVSIYEYNLAIYTDREVYSQVAYGIGSLRHVWGNALVFSEIQPLRPWVDGIVDGTITDPYDEGAIAINLYRLDLGTGRREQVAEDIRQSAASWSAAAG